MPHLTKRNVEAAKVNGSGWKWIGDDEVPGFGVRVYASDRKLFALRYRTRSGRQRMMQLGQFGELTVQEARDLARKEKVRVLDGADPLRERERRRAGIISSGSFLRKAIWATESARAPRRSAARPLGR